MTPSATEYRYKLEHRLNSEERIEEINPGRFTSSQSGKATFFVNEIKQVKLFIIGLGNVGKAFLNQIALQKAYLFKEFNLEFEIIGVANSRKMVFNEEGIDPHEVISAIASGDSFQQSKFIDKMRQLNLRNSIFIDITASGIVAGAYEEILKETKDIEDVSNEYEDFLNEK